MNMHCPCVTQNKSLGRKTTEAFVLMPDYRFTPKDTKFGFVSSLVSLCAKKSYLLNIGR